MTDETNQERTAGVRTSDIDAIDMDATDTEAVDPDLAAAKAAVSALFGLGRLWAAHGLDIGRAALKTSAITLETTAQLLGEISERVEGRQET